MIDFHYECEFSLPNGEQYADWLTEVVASENSSCGPLEYIFCDDEYLLKINQEYLAHDTYTDIITFQYSEGSSISGDIFISVERVRENAKEYGVDFDQELLRVMAHGVLHLLGYKDKSDREAALMREKENEKIKLFHVEH
ncbi:rRNA maturation RNase YbeY [Arenibacter nanhaiticus]|uniref:Endoribonuclease YbeY n=1 Tax=Arenibacter nanhaiticus TaxID=558155 RepID=A0A1M6A0D6_9FLAO|nr:rRNA maturation RNase YbeY [Arenibacter nanhaiticus]SHI29974.1 rRNA maturation RNase YbeY [Arenibacter nanhaiticus]